ncbi:hypothetical protein D1Z97_00135 [Riemerella anatipestifer]|nr:hypothetical protein M949_0505 [Riemerella anatipestifer CH3]AZZ59468.1 hypothetical protein AWB57_10815 [Riemerella anatipestifer]MDD1538068.1 hypothetical protein [Riemerella anatipestifer]MDD1548453.1 hypothetical protein [Riemerella anatipestifer]MDD1550314.1 hypothetical protein [Riemerella anatipestifer]
MSMKLVYKIFLVLFVVFIGLNLYAIDWELGFMDNENTKFVFSISAALLGVLLVFVLNTWSKLSPKK